MGFYCERGFLKKGIVEAVIEFYNQHLEFGQIPLVEASQDGVLGLVREFYIILLTVLWDDPYLTTYIQEVNNIMDPNTINAPLGVSNVSTATYKAKAREMDMKWLRDTLIMMLIRTKST